MLLWQNRNSLSLEVLVYVHELLKSPGIDGFREAALLDPLLRHDVVTSKFIFFKDLKKMPGGNVLFQMEINRVRLFCDNVNPQ
jgi:hypothetical protein